MEKNKETFGKKERKKNQKKNQGQNWEKIEKKIQTIQNSSAYITNLISK